MNRVRNILLWLITAVFLAGIVFVVCVLNLLSGAIMGAALLVVNLALICAKPAWMGIWFGGKVSPDRHPVFDESEYSSAPPSTPVSPGPPSMPVNQSYPPSTPVSPGPPSTPVTPGYPPQGMNQGYPPPGMPVNPAPQGMHMNQGYPPPDYGPAQNHPPGYSPPQPANRPMPDPGGPAEPTIFMSPQAFDPGDSTVRHVFPTELRLVSTNLKTPIVILIDRPEMVLGRSKVCGYSIPKEASEIVSRQHARIRYNPAERKYFVSDLESRNGTRLNHMPIRPGCEYPIKKDDILELADICFRVESAIGPKASGGGRL